MFQPVATFSAFSVNDIDAAKEFYTNVLGLSVEDSMGGMRISLPGGQTVFVYAKDGHQPATYTTLNFVVTDIDEAVDALQASGATFERYDSMQQDDKGIARGIAAQQGPDIAWFTDPAGNILAVLQEPEGNR